MGETTEISWCHSTFNPWIGCTKISDGCKSCYASVDTYARVSASRGLPLWGPGSTRHRTSAANWKKPFSWNKKAMRAREEWANLYGVPGVDPASAPSRPERPRVFCASLCDVFEDVAKRADGPRLDGWRAELWPTVEKCDELDWMFLTKRPQNVMRMVPEKWRAEWPRHAWIGTSVENQDAANERVPELLKVPARIRFLSMEPLLGPVDLMAAWGDAIRAPLAVAQTIDLVIVGGESGPRARPFDLAWARSLRDQCNAAGVSFFMKQMGANPTHRAQSGESLSESLVRIHNGKIDEARIKHPKGGDPSEWPADLRIREMPKGV